MKKKVIISLHGIRTRGAWQKDLCPFISERGWKYYPLDYGFFTAFKLLFPCAHQKKAQWFREKYNQICAENPGVRPSIVVHSFGSLIFAKAIEKFTDLHFDKVVLTGSIIPKDFSWDTALQREQYSSALNIVCAKDFPVKLANLFIAGASDSGGVGFFDKGNVEEVLYEKLGHSGSHGTDVYRSQIIPFLERPSILKDGSASENYLALVSSFDAACWAAITYKRQFLDRFENALRAGQFQPRKPEDPPLENTPSSLIVLIPKSASDASESGREQLMKNLKLRQFGFGPNNERTALIDASGVAMDLPSNLETFKVFDEVHGNAEAVEECLENFRTILSKLVEDPNSDFDSYLQVTTLSEILEPV